MGVAPLPPVPGEALVGQRVAAAVSGGADSVALTFWLDDLARRPQPAFELVGLIHVNHRLRGAESDGDESFCRALATRLGRAIDVVDAPVAITSRSPEAAARELRYAAFAAAADRLGATRICTAHTADDQAETVMLRLLRGAGLRGVSGIRVGRGLIVRPLLECRRAALRALLESRRERWREDASNADVSIPRNRIRRDLMPCLEAVTPGGVDALARFAAYAADDETWLEQEAIVLGASLVLREEVESGRTWKIALDRTGLVEAPAPLARRIVRWAASKIVPARPWAAVHIEAVRRLAGRHEGGGSLNLPGARVDRVANELHFVSEETLDRPEASD